MRQRNKKTNKISKNKVVLTIVVLFFIAILIAIEINIYKSEKINDIFALTKEVFRVNGNENKIILNAEIKNETNKTQHIESIELKALDKDKNEAFVYFKKINKDIKKKDKYILIINEIIDNTNIKAKKDIKDIVYIINQ